ncbi:MAG: anaerobic ribonucleoside-triphosphate reductase activating protein [Campylobacteraceae bacterium]|nr:anaerobic ribonucleoside-triphosphate reductase activating protein [Campylobacteraceae bacterium]
MFHAITPFTTLDYPDKLACIVWFSGCNMRCLYCYNAQIVEQKGTITKDDLFKFLNSRVGLLEGVVFSGGECTLNKEFTSLAKDVSELGFSLKVDTNGSNPSVLKEAIDYIDYIALDFKAPKEKFSSITHSNLYDKFIETLEFLVDLDFPFEVRTTLHADLLDENDISNMAKTLESFGYKNSYYLQNFLDTGLNFGNLTEPKNSFDINKINSNLKIELRNF